MKTLFAAPVLAIIATVMVCCTSGDCFSKLQAQAACSLPITER